MSKSYIVVAIRQALTDNWEYIATPCELPHAITSQLIQGWRETDMRNYKLTYGNLNRYYLDQGMEFYHIWRADDNEDAIRKAKEMHEGHPSVNIK